MTVIAKWAGAGITAGTTLTTSTSGTGDNAFTALSGAAPVTATGGPGPSGVRLNWSPTGAASFVDWGSSVVGSRTALAVRVYYRFSAWPSASFTVLRALNSSNAQQWAIDLGGTGAPGQVRLRNSANTANVQATANNVISVGTDLRFEALWDSSGTATAYVYAGHSTTPLATLTGATGGTGPVATMRFGPISGPTVAQYYSSDYALADTATLIGPAQVASGPNLVGVWNGSAIVPAVLRGVWDGATLQPAALRSA